MKKVILSVILLAIAVTIFSGCQETYDPNKLSTAAPSQKVLTTMRDAMREYNVDLTNYPGYCGDAWYYGTINDCIVIFQETDHNAVCCIGVANYTFKHNKSFFIAVYRDGEVCYLEEAYEKGWLTEDHIAQLHVRHSEMLEEMEQARYS